MRITPLAVWGCRLTDQQLAAAAASDCVLSHPHVVAQHCNAAFVIAVKHLINHPGDADGAIAAAKVRGRRRRVSLSGHTPTPDCNRQAPYLTLQCLLSPHAAANWVVARIGTNAGCVTCWKALCLTPASVYGVLRWGSRRGHTVVALYRQRLLHASHLQPARNQGASLILRRALVLPPQACAPGGRSHSGHPLAQAQAATRCHTLNTLPKPASMFASNRRTCH